MVRVDRTAEAAIKAALERQPLTPGKVEFAWTVAAGPTLARAASVTWEDGIVTLTARSEAWHRELERARPYLAKRLAEFLGPGVLQSLRLQAPADNPGLASHDGWQGFPGPSGFNRRR